MTRRDRSSTPRRVSGYDGPHTDVMSSESADQTSEPCTILVLWRMCRDLRAKDFARLQKGYWHG